jgi:excisionase family DNA binding protein
MEQQTLSTTADEPRASRLITADEVAALLGLSARTVWRMHSAGKLPEPIRLGRAVRWRHKEIDAWIEAGCPGSWRDQQ